MKNKLRLINMDNVEIEEIKWVWHPYIPYGKLTIVQGDPGEGKTTFVLSLIALLTTGQLLPESGTAIEPINVIYQTAEDGLADTIKPRLVEAGADCAKVLVIDESEKELTMCDERLEQAILQTGTKLVVLDPLQAYLGGSVDMHRANEVRPIFKKLAALAENTGLRRGELCALKWSDFKVINEIPTLVVGCSRSPLPYSGVVEKGTKNNKERSIILSQEIWNIVESYYYSKKIQCEELGIAISDYLFTDDKGTLIHPDTFSKRLRKIYDELEYPKAFHLHTLRHYFVSSMLHSGVDKNTVAELAGHGDTSFLEKTYCHPQTLAKQKVAVTMSNLLTDGTAYIDVDGKEQPFKIA